MAHYRAVRPLAERDLADVLESDEAAAAAADTRFWIGSGMAALPFFSSATRSRKMPASPGVTMDVALPRTMFFFASGPTFANRALYASMSLGMSKLITRAHVLYRQHTHEHQKKNDTCQWPCAN